LTLPALEASDERSRFKPKSSSSAGAGLLPGGAHSSQGLVQGPGSSRSKNPFVFAERVWESRSAGSLGARRRTRQSKPRLRTGFGSAAQAGVRGDPAPWAECGAGRFL